MSKLWQVCIMTWLINSGFLISEQPTSQENYKHERRSTQKRLFYENGSNENKR